MEKSIVELGDMKIGDGAAVRVMGVLNISSESFYNNSVASEPEEIISLIEKMETEGADIIDVGGASSAPTSIYGTEKISIEIEMQRINHAMEILDSCTDLPISVDTTSSSVAEVALEKGASMVNDISGVKEDDDMASLVAEYGVPVILMAQCSGGCADVNSTANALRESLNIAADAGIDRKKIIIDPGIGFGKPANVDFAIIKNLHQFLGMGQPLLIGVSRKAFLGTLLNQPEPANRLTGTVAANAIAVSKGADIIRAHDVAEAVIASQVGLAIKRVK
ncbi:MAG: dihydropteroate synthase [Candidatus Thorarchaeota archaeon]|nr:dihydropteroate synthase [Candidatus Thorarchaeota archaeon]